MIATEKKEVLKIRGISRYLKFLIFLLVLGLYGVLLRALYFWNDGVEVDNPSEEYKEHKKRQFEEEERREREKEKRKREAKRSEAH